MSEKCHGNEIWAATTEQALQLKRTKRRMLREDKRKIIGEKCQLWSYGSK